MIYRGTKVGPRDDAAPTSSRSLSLWSWCMKEAAQDRETHSEAGLEKGNIDQQRVYGIRIIFKDFLYFLRYGT